VTPRYVDHVARGKHQTELDDLIADWTRDQAAEDVLASMEEHGVPAGKIFKARDMMEDEHFKARNAIVKVDHPTYDKLYMQNVVPKLSATPGRVEWAGPLEVGHHNQEIYGTLLGKDDAELAALKTANII